MLIYGFRLCDVREYLRARDPSRHYDFSLGVWGHLGNTLSSFNAVGLSISYTFYGGGIHKQNLIIGVDQDFPMGRNGLSYTTGNSELGLIWDYSTHGSGSDIETDDRCKPRIDPTSCPARKE